MMKFLKVDILKTAKVKFLILLYVQLNETMTMNKSQKSMLVFDFSIEVANIGFPINISNISYSETFCSIEFEFHRKAP